MSEVLGVRSLLYWWGLLTATVFVQDWLRRVANSFKNPDLFTPDKIPFNMLTNLNSWIDGAAEYVRITVKFDPSAPLFTVRSIFIPSYALAFLVGFILIGVAASFVVRALKSSAWLDDFIALIVMYVMLRIVGHVVSLATTLPFADAFRDFVNNPLTAYLAIMVLLLFITFFGEGFQSKRAFWRAIIASSLLSLFMYPREVSSIFGIVLDALALFGAGLSNPANVPFAVAWGLVGMALALHRLAVSEDGRGSRGGGGGNLKSGDATQANVEVGCK